MRKGIKPNPKKDRNARRKSKPTWRRAKATLRQVFDAVVKGRDGKDKIKKTW